MYSTPRYAPHSAYAPYEYKTTPMNAPNYSSSKYGYTTTPVKPSSKGHQRRATEHSYPSTKPSATYYTSPHYQSGYYTNTHYPPPPPKQSDFAAATDKMRKKARTSSGQDGSKQSRYVYQNVKDGKSYTSKPQYYPAYVNDEDEGYYSPTKDVPPPPYYEHPHYYRDGYFTDQHAYDQVPKYKPPPAEKPKPKPQPQKTTSRPRAASYSTQPQRPAPQQRPRTSSSAKPQPTSPLKATAADAARVGIPAGFSYKNWDPTEEPILLLGSVFDANSLGRWIYDWTVFHHGAATPMSDLAGELWLLLIQLAGKIKRAEEVMNRIRRRDDQDLVEDFLESGERLWKRFNKILKACEDFMWQVAKREAKRKGTTANTIVMGPKSGCEFVDSIFGRDRKLEDTEKLMTGMRLWSMRFDANCEDILRHPNG